MFQRSNEQCSEDRASCCIRVRVSEVVNISFQCSSLKQLCHLMSQGTMGLFLARINVLLKILPSAKI